MAKNANRLDGELFKELLESDMWYFILVSLFSADTLTSTEACEKSLRLIEEMESLLPVIKGIDEERKKKVNEELIKAKTIVIRDKNSFANEK